jgi:glutathione peroxidase
MIPTQIIAFLRNLILATFVCGVLCAPGTALAGGMSVAESAYNFTFKDTDGVPFPLETYRGKVLLVVNTASRCGFTPQYAELEALYETYKDKGLVVLAIPSDDFGSEEPGDDRQIKAFAFSKFHITFPIMGKTDVVGDARHPFYAWAAEQNKGGFFLSTPRWNFQKYLIGRDGQLVDSFLPTTTPTSSSIVKSVELALADKSK